MKKCFLFLILGDGSRRISPLRPRIRCWLSSKIREPFWPQRKRLGETSRAARNLVYSFKFHLRIRAAAGLERGREKRRSATMMVLEVPPFDPFFFFFFFSLFNVRSRPLLSPFTARSYVHIGSPYTSRR